MGVPVVMTLHNYRLLCPSATLFHRGEVLTASIQAGFPWEAVRKGVHSRSAVKTWWLAFTYWLHRSIGTWRMVEQYITLTDFAKQLFVNSSLGITADKFITKPNFVSAGPETIATRGSHLLFVCRLTQAKGVHVLYKAFACTA